MTIICDFDTIQEMAHAIGNSANAIERQKYTLRLWNRYAPENTIWWLVPSSEWPAYPYGKGIVSPGDSLRPDQVFCGLHVEKGFDPKVAEFYAWPRQHKQLLGPNWTWHQLLKSFRDGTLASVAQSISQVTNEAIYLEVAAWYGADEEDFDPYVLFDRNQECRSRLDGGQVWFSVEGEKLAVEMSLCLQDVSRPLTRCQSLPELADTFSRSKELGWCWIDVSFGTMVWLERNAPEPGENWDANDVWDKLIRPWQPWIL